jgi:hypothetical protein
MTIGAKVSQAVEDLEEFKVWVNDAVSNAEGDFQVTFANDMQDRFNKYGADMFVSEKQLALLKQIAGVED